MPKPPKTYDLSGDAKKGTPLWKTHDFWKRTLASLVDNKDYISWYDKGRETEKLALRRIKGNPNQKKDLINAVAALARAQVSEVLYNDPIPTCRAKQNREQLKQMEPGWKKLLKNAAAHNEYTHQIIGMHFVLWGIGILKILPSPTGISFQHVRPDRVIFDERWIGMGGEPQDKAYIIGEKITKLLSELIDDKEYDSEAIKEIETKRAKPGTEPNETIEVDIWEWNFRVGDEWHVVTYCQDATKLLQCDFEPINEPTYSWILVPGPIGLNNGVMGENTDLDTKLNQIMKRSMKIAAKRGYAIFYDKNVVEKFDITKMKEGVVSVGVDVPSDQTLKDYVNMQKVGDFDQKDAGAIATLREAMQWQSGSTPEKLSQARKPVTATETRYVAAQQQMRAAPWARLVDRYLDRSMQLAALWMKYLWDMGYHDWFTSILDEKEMMLFSQWMPHLSRDLQEFEFGVESGSTQKFRNVEIVQQIDHFIEKLPIIQDRLMRAGKVLDEESIYMRYMRALDGLGNPDELIRDMTPQELQQMEMQRAQAEEGMMPGMEGGPEGEVPGGAEGGEPQTAQEMLGALGAMR